MTALLSLNNIPKGPKYLIWVRGTECIYYAQNVLDDTNLLNKLKDVQEYLVLQYPHGVSSDETNEMRKKFKDACIQIDYIMNGWEK